MKIRVLVLSPFEYIYGSKRYFVQTGDSIYLDPSKKEEKEELKYILSPASEYQKWLWVDEYEVGFILEEIKREFEGISLDKKEDIKDKEITEGMQYKVKNPEVVFNAPEEPAENIFLNPEIEAVVEEEKDIPADVEEKENSALLETDLEKDILKRRLELEETHWTKLKKLAESLGIEYKEKDQAIEEIIAVEFKVEE